MTTIAGTLECTDDIMLLEIFLQLTDGQIEDYLNCTIDADNMSRCIDVRDRPVIAVIVIFLGDDAMCKRSTTRVGLEAESEGKSPRDEVFDRGFSVERLFNRVILLDCHDTIRQSKVATIQKRRATYRTQTDEPKPYRAYACGAG